MEDFTVEELRLMLGIIQTAEHNIDVDFTSGHDIARMNFEVLRRVVESIDYAGTMIDTFRHIDGADYKDAMGQITSAIRGHRELRDRAERITAEVFGQR